jgi:hypothetical protein
MQHNNLGNSLISKADAFLAAALSNAGLGARVVANPPDRYTRANLFNTNIATPRYPHSSTKQHTKTAERQYTVTINGHSYMQTRDSKSIRALREHEAYMANLKEFADVELAAIALVAPEDKPKRTRAKKVAAPAESQETI